MSLNELLLPKLAEWRPADRQTLQASEDGSPWRASITVDNGDAYSCRVWEMTVRRSPSGDPVNLKSWTESISNEVTGLLEPLGLVEIDELSQSALMRSQEPSLRGPHLAYYEVILKASGEATMRRYQANQTGPARREQAPFTLTHEVLAKLAEDLLPSEPND
jgi:hypothetical protein